MSNVTSDTNLLFRLENGDEVSIRQLFAEHFRFLCYFARQLVENEQDAEDIVVECFLKLMKNNKEFNDVNAIKGFLFKATRNACIDYWRRKRVREKNLLQFTPSVYDDEDFGAYEMINAKLLQLVYKEIESLPAQCKLIFKAIFIEGKKTAVIAEELALSQQTILNQKTKALRLLRMKLKDPDLYFLTLCLSHLLRQGLSAD